MNNTILTPEKLIRLLRAYAECMWGNGCDCDTCPMPYKEKLCHQRECVDFDGKYIPLAANAIESLTRQLAERDQEIERLREAQRWTDTEYDTPDIGQAVLLYMPDKETDNIRAGEYMGEGDYRIGNKLYRGMEIDAWLPLPAPPERIGDADKTMEDT